MISQIARGIFGGRGVFYYVVQAATMFILVLAANTAFADFPRLASIVARDRFLPRQFMNQGDRLAFSNGIVILSVLAGVLLFVFGGDTHALIPLYMIGVFVSFTLSQAGMVRHGARARRRAGARARRSTASAPLVTGVVLVVVAITKFGEGAWIILVMIPMLVLVFEVTAATTTASPHSSRCAAGSPGPAARHVVIVPVGGVQRAVVQALRVCAHAVRRRARGVRGARCRRRPQRSAGVGDVGTGHAARDPAFARIGRFWSRCSNTSSRSSVRIRTATSRSSSRSSCPGALWQHLLHNQHALLLKGALLFKPNLVVTSVPFHLGRVDGTTAPERVSSPAAGVHEGIDTLNATRPTSGTRTA